MSSNPDDLGPKFRLSNPLSNISTSSEDSVEGLSAVAREVTLSSESDEEVEEAFTPTGKVPPLSLRGLIPPPEVPPTVDPPASTPGETYKHTYRIEKKRGPKLSITCQLPIGMPPKRKRGRPPKKPQDPSMMAAQAAKIAAQAEAARRLELQARELSQPPPNPVEIVESEDEEEEEVVDPPQPHTRSDGSTIDWDDFLEHPENLIFIPPVSYFKHAPLAGVWEALSQPGRVIELHNIFLQFQYPLYWIASLVGAKGYKMLVKYERFGLKPDHYAWISWASDVPKFIGWADRNDAILSPGPDVKNQFPDWHEMAKGFLSGKSTIPENHGDIITKLIQSSLYFTVNGVKISKIELGMMLEVLDVKNIGRNKIARVVGIIGDRINAFGIEEILPDDTGTWYSIHSELIHPIGWSNEVGHPLLEPADFPIKSGRLDKSIFAPIKVRDRSKFNLSEGMYLEVRHPLYPFKIAPASVKRLLKHDYIIVQIETAADYRNKVRFCFHLSSPYIYRCGWAATQGIALEAPKEVFTTFYWPSYLTMKGLEPAPLEWLDKTREENKFKVGMKLEAAWMGKQPYIGPATVEKVSEHMLLISFDGWPKVPKYSQWMDFQSPDIYPIGYCTMMGHKLSSNPDLPSRVHEGIAKSLIDAQGRSSPGISVYSELEDKELYDLLDANREVENIPII